MKNKIAALLSALCVLLVIAANIAAYIFYKETKQVNAFVSRFSNRYPNRCLYKDRLTPNGIKDIEVPCRILDLVGEIK